MSRIIGQVIGAIVLVALIVAALAAANWAWVWMTAEISGRVEAQRQIESAPSRIANYEHFFDLCASAERKQASLGAQRLLLEETSDPTEARRVRQNIAALTAALAGDAARYNADVQKDYTRARFLDSGLPKSIDPDRPIICGGGW